jgi:NAD(P)-dependent dehydrogenase (short-subunit alcohol dehydrogenase family)
MAEGRFDNPIVAALTGFLDLFRKQDLSKRLSDSDRIDGKTCLVTGANSGLGFALAVDLAKRGGHVIMACRREIPEAGEKVKKISKSEKVEMRYLDLSKIDAIHNFCDELKKEKRSIDVCILNAGVALPKARKTLSGLEELFLVNYLSNVILTSRLLSDGTIANDILAKNGKESKSRILFISSDSHQGSSYVDYEEFGKYIDYGVSKGMEYYSYYKLVANTYFTELSRRINQNNNIDVGIHVICPGPVNTNIVKEAPWLLRKILRGIFYIIFKSPETAAKAVVYMAISEDFNGKTNEYLHMFNNKSMDSKVYEEKEGKKLWDETHKLWKSVDEKFVSLKISG